MGHVGTLDPLAQGVLPLALGQATKLIECTQDYDKTYEFTVMFGATTETGDAEGQIVGRTELIPTLSELAGVLGGFVGRIQQTPSKYSAIKVDGTRAYERVRTGQSFVMPTRSVEVYLLEVKECILPIATLVARVSKGTYIRTLAEDIAVALGSLAYTVDRKRTQVGPFRLEEAVYPWKAFS